MTKAKISEPSISVAVGSNRSPIRSSTGRRKKYEVPQSPCDMRVNGAFGPRFRTVQSFNNPMPLAPGTQLGRHEIVVPIGALNKV